MTKQKYDLTNPGGQPKGPFDEPIDDSGWLKDLRMSLGILGPILMVVVGLGVFALAVFKFIG